MAETNLRAYLGEIDSIIEQGRHDEAIAHCRHLLSAYPKHLDAYRLLGKALLEQGQHSDAVDVFQRVLSVAPDDFVAHVGMAIIREDESNLEAAIYHMERAYEVSPANPAIHEELKRLITQRDGEAPVRVRLSRGALARMYTHGDHAEMALIELRAAMAADPDRPDLLALLAEAQWRAGHRAQAAETCAALLEKLPYAQTANRTLAEILEAENRQDEALPYRQRLQALDPYEAFVDKSNGASAASVPADQVRIERLPGAASEGLQPDWTQSSGAQLQESRADQLDTGQVPDWLRATPAPASASVPSAPSAAPTDALEMDTGLFGDLPDWMKSSLTVPGTGPLPPEPPAPLPTIASVPVESAVPDWLQELPTGPEEVSAEVLPADTDAAIPDWMHDSGWVTATAESAQSPEVTQTEDEPVVQDVSDAAAPTADWNPPATQAATPGTTEDFLASLRADVILPASEPATPSPMAPEREPAAEFESMPDWLRQVLEKDDTGMLSLGSTTSPFSQTGMLNQPSGTTPPLSSPPPDDMEVWVAPEAPAPSAASAPTPPVPPVAPEKSDDTLAWLRGLTAESCVAPQTQVAPEPMPPSSEPAFSEPPPPPEVPEPAVSQPAEPLPDWLRAAVEPPAAEAAAAPVSFAEVPAAPVEATAPAPAAAPVQPENGVAAVQPKKGRRSKSGARGAAKPQQDPDEQLEQARRSYIGGSRGEALQLYGNVIRSGQHLAQVIADLEEMRGQSPDDEAVLQALGDAYARDNQLQRALEIYRQALEQL